MKNPPRRRPAEVVVIRQRIAGPPPCRACGSDQHGHYLFRNGDIACGSAMAEHTMNVLVGTQPTAFSISGSVKKPESS